VKTEHRYLWRVIDHGKSRVTKFHLTDEQAMRTVQNGAPSHC
jgi:hypothetical protein